MPIQHSELTVITKAKDLCRYILTVTEKSPKRFRFTLTGRMQNLALDVLSLLNRANEVFVDTKLLADLDRTIHALREKQMPDTDAEQQRAADKLLTLRLARATAFEGRISKRIDRQHEAMAALRELDTLTTLAAEQGAILPKQQKQMAEYICDTRRLLGAWIKSDRKRYNY